MKKKKKKRGKRRRRSRRSRRKGRKQGCGVYVSSREQRPTEREVTTLLLPTFRAVATKSSIRSCTGPGFRVSGLGDRVPSFGFQLSGLGLRVSGFGFGFRAVATKSPPRSCTPPALRVESNRLFEILYLQWRLRCQVVPPVLPGGHI